MRVFTDGKRHVVVGPVGADFFEPGQKGRRAPLWSAQPKGQGRFWSRDVLAVVDADTTWVARDGRGRVLGPDGKVIAEVPGLVLDAVGLDDGRVLACVVPPGQPGAQLLVVDGRTPDLGAGRRIDLGKPSPAPWPHQGGAYADVEDEDDDEALDAPPGTLALPLEGVSGLAAYQPVVLTRSPFGVAVVARQTGLVAVLERDAGAVRFAFTVPTDDEIDLVGTATDAGVLLVATSQARNSSAYHLAPDGKALATQMKVGKQPALAWSGAIVDEARALLLGDGALLELELATLAVKASMPFEERPGGVVTLDGTPDELVIGLGHAAHSVKRKGRGKKTLEVAVLEPPPPPKPPPLPVGPARRTGSPSLAALSRTPSWEVAQGEELTIELTIGNQGGEARGLWVELGGPGAASVEALRVERADQPEAKFAAGATGPRAELADAMVAAGFEPVKKGDPLPPAPALPLRLVLRGQKAGQGLLTIRVGPRGLDGTRGSSLLGRNITVR